jgi:predicted metalloprotease
MRTDNQRRSDNFEDRGRGSGAAAGGVGLGVLFAIARRIGIRGTLIAVAVLAGAYFLVPGVRPVINQIIGIGGGAAGGAAAQGEGATCDASAEACDFSRVVLAATEDVWTQQFSQGRVPAYGRGAPNAYSPPTLAVFTDNVVSGCGAAQSAMGPFYCPRDSKLYLDPTFFDLMRDRLHSPGDFAQAYVIAHEVGHHVQNLTGATNHALPGENQNRTSVRVELQADCYAGVWGHHKRGDLVIDDSDLREALAAADAIGDDALSQGRASPQEYTHGTSAQRVRWFRQGFTSGNPRQCDTFAVPAGQL